MMNNITDHYRTHWQLLRLEPPWHPLEHYEPPRWRFDSQRGLELAGHATGGEPGSVVGHLPQDIVAQLDPELIGTRRQTSHSEFILDADGNVRGWPL